MTATVVPLSAAAEHRAARRRKQRNRAEATAHLYCGLFVAGMGAVHTCDAMLGEPMGVSER
jgi:hypothetical protein